MDNGKKDEIIFVASEQVFCDGGRGPLGHPGVYLNIGHEHQIICPYCSQKFAINPSLHESDVVEDEY